MLRATMILNAQACLTHWVVATALRGFAQALPLDELVVAHEIDCGLTAATV